jgi:hypothetical protein
VRGRARSVIEESFCIGRGMGSGLFGTRRYMLLLEERARALEGDSNSVWN